MPSACWCCHTWLWLSAADVFASMCCAAQLWQLSLKCSQRETPSQLADAYVDDFPSDGGSALNLHEDVWEGVASPKDHLKNGSRDCTEKGAAPFESTKEQHCRVCLVQLPAPFCSFSSASLHPLSQTGLTNALSFLDFLHAAVAASWAVLLLRGRQKSALFVCVSLATNSGSFCSKRREVTNRDVTILFSYPGMVQ